MSISLVLVFAIIGLAIWGLGGAIVAGALGWLVAYLLISLNPKLKAEHSTVNVDGLEKRVRDLERQVLLLRQQLKRLSPDLQDEEVTAVEPTITVPVAEPAPVAADPIEDVPDQLHAPSEIIATTVKVESDPWIVERATGESTPDIFKRILSFFSGGNPVVRVGVVVLFFGVAFLLRYAAEHAYVPIEFRLAGIAMEYHRNIVFEKAYM